jgi:hypothetical protein
MKREHEREARSSVTRSSFRAGALALALAGALAGTVGCGDDEPGVDVVGGGDAGADAPAAIARDGAILPSPDAGTDAPAASPVADAGPGPGGALACLDAGAGAPKDGGVGRRDAGVVWAAPPDVTCEPRLDEPLPVVAGRVRHCAFDIGSKNVKLMISSMAPGDRLSFEEERSCKAGRNLGEKTYDTASETRRPLPVADLDALVTLLQGYAALCKIEGAELVGAVATEWARRATNPDEIKAALRSKLGVDLQILTADKEGAYGYSSATNDTPKKIILDHGSRSVQLSYWADGDPEPKVGKFALGSEEAADRFFGSAQYKDYAAARAAYVARLGELATPELAPLRERLAAGKLDKELISLGDSGVILAVEGKLRDPCNGRWVDEATYEQRSEERRMTEPRPRMRMLTAAAIKAFLTDLEKNPAWFEELRSEKIKKAYGNKVLSSLALMSYLLETHGLDRVRFVTGDMIDGFILEQVQKR